MNEQLFWRIRMGGKQYGSVSDEQLFKLIADGKINENTEVNHPTHTRGQWASAKTVSYLSHRLQRLMPHSSFEAPSPPPVEDYEDVLDHESNGNSSLARHRFVPKKYRSKWTFIVCSGLELTAIAWTVVFAWIIVAAGPGEYLVLQTGNSFARIFDQPNTPLSFWMMAFSWSVFQHAQYVLYLIAASQLLRLIDQIRLKP